MVRVTGGCGGAGGGTGLRVWVGRPGADPRAGARALVVALAAQVCGADPRELRVERGANGRPEVPGSGVQVSLSHTRGAVAVAAGVGVAVGVDVEVVRTVPVERLARRWLAPGEARWLAGREAGERSAAFLGLWTQKEALGKAIGRGLEGGALLAHPVPRPGAGGGDRDRLVAVDGLAGCAVAVREVGGLVVAVAARGGAAAGARACFAWREVPGAA